MTTIPPDDHLARYCGHRKLNEQGRPEAAAFLKAEPEDYVSTNRLEYFHPYHRTTQLGGVRKILRQKMNRLGSTAKLAVFEVQAAVMACAREGIPINIQSTGDPDDPSHTGIYRDLAYEAQVALVLAEEVPHRMYKAVP